MPARLDSSTGIMCLANDAVSDGLIALCNSLRRHDKHMLTVIPYDEQLKRTREVLAEYGYDLFGDSDLLVDMDALGGRYWPDATQKAPNMRKFCAFWGPYERVLFVDSDVIVLQSMDAYFAAFERCQADFMYFATDVDNVYRAGALRDQMVKQYGTAGFNAGVFMARRDALTPADVWRLCDAADGMRHGFVDNLEQSFMNFCVDASRLRTVNASSAVSDRVVAGALMRMRGRPDRLVLADARMPETGRRVSMVHWAGYGCGPFMPYRRLFMRYRLGAEWSVMRELWFEIGGLARTARRMTLRRIYHVVRRWPWHGKNWLAARGIVRW